MSRGGVTVRVDLSGMDARLSASRLASARLDLMEEVAADSNFYAPRLTGALQEGMLVDRGGGQVVWPAEYAGVVYEMPPERIHRRPAPAGNPNASPRWFEAARDERLAEWERTVAEDLS